MPEYIIAQVSGGVLQSIHFTGDNSNVEAIILDYDANPELNIEAIKHILVTANQVF